MCHIAWHSVWVDDLVQDLLERAAQERRTAGDAVVFAVQQARSAGWSWDRISVALGGVPTGETLRRTFGVHLDVPPGLP